MAVLLHVVIAIVSLGFNAYLFVTPSQTKLRLSYGLIALTVASGTYLLVTKPAHMLEACTAGLLYLGLSTLSVVLVRRKLADEHIVR